MSNFFYKLISAFFGFSSGVVVAGGVFAFIAMIGIVPRLAQKTETIKKIPFYEDIIVIGGLFGTTTMFINYDFSYLNFFAVILIILFSFFTGMFIGILAVSLAEVLNVMPIFTRRLRIVKGLSIFVLFIALGKMIGSLIYFYIF